MTYADRNLDTDTNDIITYADRNLDTDRLTVVTSFVELNKYLIIIQTYNIFLICRLFYDFRTYI
jgi:hypothetical protein